MVPSGSTVMVVPSGMTRPASDVVATWDSISPWTKAVVATCVESSPAAAVGAVGVPVNAGDAVGALSEMRSLTLESYSANLSRSTMFS